MAYIYEKKIKGKSYYYLRISKRSKGKIITKDIAYLGSDPSTIKKKLDELPKKYKTDLRKGYKTIKRFIDSNHYLQKAKKLKLKQNLYLEKDILEQIEAIKVHFNSHFSKLNKRVIKETYKDFLIDFAFNTTSIEGNTITLKEAEKLLRENLTPKEKAPREIFDIQNTEQVFFYLLEKKPVFNQKLIIEIHDLLLKNIDERTGYRLHDIRVFKAKFKSSPVKYIKADMELLMQWHKEHKKKLHPLVLTVLFHHKFEKIHPFSDGNGRTGRMILNYLLLQSGYPPLIIQKRNRAQYLKALGKADTTSIKSKDPKPFKQLLEYTCSEAITSYWNNFNI